MLFALVYLLLRRAVLSIAGSSNEQMNTEVELVVLRHQLKVLRRQVTKPRLRRCDRLFMAAISRALPRAQWSSFLVSPKTLLRWHRELVRRKWTALLDAGVSEAIIERATGEGWLNFDGIDDRLPSDPGPRSSRTFAEYQATAGPRAAFLPAVYEVLGLPEPDPSRPIHRDEEAMFQRFLAGWKAADEESLLRAARLIAEGTRSATLGWSELFEEQIAGPARERMLRGEMDRFPDEARAAFATLIRVAPEMFTWLSTRYLEQRTTVKMVDGFERFLASRNLAPDPESPAPPAIVFVDLSGFTRLTEERGDETAVHTATSLQREADAAATRHGGRLNRTSGRCTHVYTYESLLHFLHILAAIVWVGGVLPLNVLAVRVGRGPDRAAQASLLRLSDLYGRVSSSRRSDAHGTIAQDQTRSRRASMKLGLQIYSTEESSPPGSPISG